MIDGAQVVSRLAVLRFGEKKMQRVEPATTSQQQPPRLAPMPSQAGAAPRAEFGDYKIIRRNGAVVGFEPSKISIALTKAFLAVNGGQGANSARIRELVETLTGSVVTSLIRRMPSGGMFHIEDIQDQVELALMRSGEHEVARAYVLYREKRAADRAEVRKNKPSTESALHVTENGVRILFDPGRIRELVEAACD